MSQKKNPAPCGHAAALEKTHQLSAFVSRVTHPASKSHLSLSSHFSKLTDLLIRARTAPTARRKYEIYGQAHRLVRTLFHDLKRLKNKKRIPMAHLDFLQNDLECLDSAITGTKQLLRNYLAMEKV